MKTKLDIILETQAAYADPFNTAVIGLGTDITCVITTEDGRHCAVGRCMTEEYQKYYIEATGPDISRGEMEDESLKPEYRGHEPSFWLALQRFHDAIGNESVVHVVQTNWNVLIEKALLDDLETIPSPSEQTDLQ